MLPDGSKFCSVCGARIDESFVNSNEPVMTAEPVMQNFGAVDEPAAVGTQSPAVDLYKSPVQPSDSFAEPVSAVPNPTDYSFPQTMAENATSSPLSGQTFGSIESSYIPPYNPSAASTGAGIQTASVISNAPAAAAVKKKSKKPVIIISIASVLAAIIAAASIFFFTNRAGFLSLFMGKANYATMVEGNSLKQVAGSIDKTSIVNGVKFVSALYSSAYNRGMSNNGNFYSMPMSERIIKTSDGNSVSYVSVFEAMDKYVKEYFGTNSVNFSFGMDIDLTDEGKTLVCDSFNVKESDFDEIIKYLNDAKISAGITTSDSALAMKADADIDNLKFDAKVLVTKAGKVYITLPFASETGILIDIGEIEDIEVNDSEEAESIAIELDEDEVERLINEMVELYLDTYKSSEIEMENGEVTAAEVTASGKVLTAELDSDKIEEFISNVMEKLASDDYFIEKIAGYLQGIGIDIDESDISDKISDAADNINLKSDLTLVITTVVNNSGDVIGKSYEFSLDDDSVMIAYAVGKDNQTAFEMRLPNDVSCSMVSAAENDTTGEVTVKFTSKGSDNKKQTLSINLGYSDIKTEQFCGKDMTTGKFELKLGMPKDFTEEVPANIAELCDSTFTYETSISDNTANMKVGINSGKFGTASVSVGIIVEDNSSDLNEPSDVLDFSPYMDGEMPDEEFKNKFIAFLEEIRDAVDSQNGGELADELVSALNSTIDAANEADSDDVYDLLDDISESANELSDIYNDYYYDVFSNDDALDTEINDIYDGYYDLYYEVYDDSQISFNELSDYRQKFNALEKRKEDLKKMVEQSYENGYNF